MSTPFDVRPGAMGEKKIRVAPAARPLRVDEARCNMSGEKKNQGSASGPPAES